MFFEKEAMKEQGLVDLLVTWTKLAVRIFCLFVVKVNLKCLW